MTSFSLPQPYLGPRALFLALDLGSSQASGGLDLHLPPRPARQPIPMCLGWENFCHLRHWVRAWKGEKNPLGGIQNHVFTTPPDLPSPH